MPKNVAVIQARMSSTRLPGKVIAPIAGQPAILFMIGRVRRAVTIQEVVVATSQDPTDDSLATMLESAGVRVFRGHLDDVLGRFDLAARGTGAAVVVRLTGDCPLIDPLLIDKVVEALDKHDADYASNVDPPTYADGLDVEAFTRATLDRAMREAESGPEREHVTLWMRSAASALKRVSVHGPVDSSHLRLTIDHPEDLASVRRLVDAIGDATAAFDHYDMLRCIELNPGLLNNGGIQRNEKSLPS